MSGEQPWPVATILQAVGGALTIGPNPNIQSDESIVSLELLIVNESLEDLVLLPILMDRDTWSSILSNIHNTVPQEDTDESE